MDVQVAVDACGRREGEIERDVARATVLEVVGPAQRERMFVAERWFENRWRPAVVRVTARAVPVEVTVGILRVVRRRRETSEQDPHDQGGDVQNPRPGHRVSSERRDKSVRTSRWHRP